MGSEAVVPNLWITRRGLGSPLSAGRRGAGFHPLGDVPVGSETPRDGGRPPATERMPLARYKHAYLLVQSSDRTFDHVSAPGALAPHAGIYRCQACGLEVVARRGERLPPDGHHAHEASVGRARWRLAVSTQAEPGDRL